MATKDLTDKQVLEAMRDSKATHFTLWPYELLAQRTGQTEKVCYRAMERADAHGLIEYGVSLRTGWLTQKGEALLAGEDVSNGFDWRGNRIHPANAEHEGKS